MLSRNGLSMILIAVFAVCGILFSPGCMNEDTRQIQTYQNPIGVDVSDPSIVTYDNRYYLYGTTHSDRGFGCWRSKDLINWEFQGFAFEKDDDMWTQNNLWAPQVVKYNDAFYMFFSASPEPHQGKDFRICVAKSPTPDGSFQLVKTRLGEGLHDETYGMIDPYVFFDDDGRIYLYHSVCRTDATSEIWVVELTDKLTETKGEAVRCTRPEQEWENTRIDQGGVGYLWNEAPAIIKHKGTYYLLYSANAYFSKYYGIGYATANNPFGPWQKYENNPILSYTDKVSGPGHCCLVETFEGELFAAYHRHKSMKGGGERELAIDRVVFEKVEDGLDILNILGPTNTPQPAPGEPVSQDN